MEEKPVEECKIMDAESLRWIVRCFPRRGFLSNVPTLIGEEPTEKNKAELILEMNSLREDILHLIKKALAAGLINRRSLNYRQLL